MGQVVMLGSLDVGQGSEQVHQQLWFDTIFDKVGLVELEL